MIIRIRQSNGERRTIGTLINRTFTKRVKESMHLYKKLDAWGIDADVFIKTLKAESDYIVVEDIESRNVYRVKTEVFSDNGKYLHFKPHRAQIFLPRMYWEMSGKNSPKKPTVLSERMYNYLRLIAHRKGEEFRWVTRDVLIKVAFKNKYKWSTVQKALNILGGGYVYPDIAFTSMNGKSVYGWYKMEQEDKHKISFMVKMFDELPYKAPDESDKKEKQFFYRKGLQREMEEEYETLKRNSRGI